MARKKVVTTEETDGDEGELLPQSVMVEPELDPDLDVIEELKALAGDDGVKWIVHKISTRPGDKGGWCAEYQTGELSLSGIRDTFGGGRYKIQGRRISGGQIITQRTLDIVETPKPPGANGGSPGIDVAALAAALKPGDNAMLPLLLKMMDSNTQQMTALFGSLNRGSDNKQPSAMELVALVKALQPEKRNEEEGAVSLLLKGLELGREMGGGGSTDWMDLAKSGLGLVKPLVEAQARNSALSAPVAAPAAAALTGPNPAAMPAPAPAASPAPPTGVDPMLQQLNWLRAQLNTLVFQAAKHNAGKGGDPELYADIVLDNLPVYIDPEQLYARLAADDALDQLVSVDGRVDQYRPWFAAFRQAILDSFAPETDGMDGMDGMDGGDGGDGS